MRTELDEHTTETVTYHIEVLGGLWWPIGADAVQTLTLTGSEYAQGADPIQELERIETAILDQSGDFSSVYAFAVEKQTTTRRYLDSRLWKSETVFDTLQSFTDAEQDRVWDCTNDCED